MILPRMTYLSYNVEITINVLLGVGCKGRVAFGLLTLNSTKNYIVHQLIFTSRK